MTNKYEAARAAFKLDVVTRYRTVKYCDRSKPIYLV